jgi:hypothetical protein
MLKLNYEGGETMRKKFGIIAFVLLLASPATAEITLNCTNNEGFGHLLTLSPERGTWTHWTVFNRFIPKHTGTTEKLITTTSEYILDQNDVYQKWIDRRTGFIWLRSFDILHGSPTKCVPAEKPKLKF